MWAAGGRTWLVLGVVLHQRAGTSPAEGLGAALAAGEKMIRSVQRSLAVALAAHHGSAPTAAQAMSRCPGLSGSHSTSSTVASSARRPLW